MKRILSFFLSAFTIISCLLPAGAANTEIPALETEEEIIAYLHSSASATTTNEYDVLKERQSAASRTLLQKDANSDERAAAEEILAFDPVKYYYDLKLQGEEYLINHGYSGDQLNAILNFDGSEDALYRASASVTSDLLITERGNGASGRYYTAKYIFSWSGVPSYNIIDLVAIASDSYYFTGIGSSNVYYRASGITNSLEKSYAVNSMKKCFGRAAGIDMNMAWENNNRMYYVSTGHVSARFNNQNGIVQSAVAGSYIHAETRLSAAPTASISFPGGINAGLNFGLISGMHSYDESTPLVVSIS